MSRLGGRHEVTIGALADAMGVLEDEAGDEEEEEDGPEEGEANVPLLVAKVDFRR